MARDFPKDSASLLDWPAGTFYGFINGKTKCSAHAWVYADTLTSSATGNIVFTGQIATGTAGIKLNVGGSPNRIKVAARSASGEVLETHTGTANFSTGAWHSFGGVVDLTNDTIYGYYDGAADGSTVVTLDNATFTQSSTSTKDYVGGYEGASSTNQFDGRIAEIAMWGDALTADEFAALAKGISPLVVRPKDLVMYIPLIGGRTSEINLMGSAVGTYTSSGIVDIAHPPVFYPARRSIFKMGGAAAPPVVRHNLALLGVGA